MMATLLCVPGEKGQKEGWVAASRLVTSGIAAYHHSAKIRTMMREREQKDVATVKVVNITGKFCTVSNLFFFRSLKSPNQRISKKRQRQRLRLAPTSKH